MHYCVNKRLCLGGYAVLLFSFELCLHKVIRRRCRTSSVHLLFSFELCFVAKIRARPLAEKTETCYFLLNYAEDPDVHPYYEYAYHSLLFSFELCTSGTWLRGLLAASFPCYFLLNYAARKRGKLVEREVYALLFSFELCAGDGNSRCCRGALPCYFLLNYACLTILVLLNHLWLTELEELAIFFWIMRGEANVYKRCAPSEDYSNLPCYFLLNYAILRT